MGGAGINRMVERFIKLSGFDSESFHEREIAEYIIGKYLEEPAGGHLCACREPFPFMKNWDIKKGMI